MSLLPHTHPPTLRPTHLQENNGVPAAIAELERVLAATTGPSPDPAVLPICMAVLARYDDVDIVLGTASHAHRSLSPRPPRAP